MLRILRPTRASLARRFRAFSTDKDITYVDLNNPDSSPEAEAAASKFFEYQTGRWLQNDRAERAKRTVSFDFKGLLELLKMEVDVTQAGVAIETLEPLFEGKHNKLYKIVLKDQRSFVLRIPYALGSEEYRKFRLLSEAATLDFLGNVAFKDHEKFRATLPLAYSGSSDNLLGSPFILTSFVNGTKLAANWKPWSTEVEDKLPVIQPMAEMAGTMLKQKFPAYGSLYFKRDLPQGTAYIPFDDKYVIGPSTEKRFWRGESADAGKDMRGPWESWQDYLKATADVQLAYAKELTGTGSPNYESAERYAKLAPSLFSESDLSDERASPRLYDPDFSPMNVISQDGEKFWLIDVENTVVKPYVFHGVPWFVRNPGERIFKLEDVPNYDQLPEQQKRVINHFFSLTQSEFTYEKLLRDEVPELIYAHHPNLKRREEVVHRAMQTDIETGFYNDLDYAIFRLMQLWKIAGDGSEPPVDFSDSETDKLANSIAAWNQQLMRNKFLESKGFVPADEFDTLLGTGALRVLDDKKGNYELTEEYLNTQDPLKGI